MFLRHLVPWTSLDIRGKFYGQGNPFVLGGLNVRSNRLLSRLLMSFLSCNVIQFFLIQSVISWWRVHCDKVTMWRVHCFSGNVCDEFTVTSSLCDEFSVWRLHRVTSSLVALMADYCTRTRVRAWYRHGNPCWLSRYWCARVPVLASAIFIMAALCNKAGHYILPCGFFFLFSSFFFSLPNLSGGR